MDEIVIEELAKRIAPLAAAGDAGAFSKELNQIDWRQRLAVAQKVKDVLEARAGAQLPGLSIVSGERGEERELLDVQSGGGTRDIYDRPVEKLGQKVMQSMKQGDDAAVKDVFKQLGWLQKEELVHELSRLHEQEKRVRPELTGSFAGEIRHEEELPVFVHIRYAPPEGGKLRDVLIDHYEPEDVFKGQLPRQVLAQNFDKLDRNHNGSLTWSEIDEDLVDPSLSSNEELSILIALYKVAHNQSPAVGELNLTPEELKAMVEADRSTAKTTTILRDLAGEFHLCDEDKDGTLSRQETERALSEQSQVLRENLYPMLTEWKKGLGLPEGRGLSENELRLAVAELDQLSLWRRELQVKLRDRRPELFADKDDPLNSISPEAIKQGQAGNCLFIAALASLAAVNPKAIKEMIADNGDGTYTVGFPTKDNSPITVSAPTTAEQAVYLAPTAHGIWPNILEKALGRAVGGTTVPQDATTATSLARVMKDEQELLERLTGHPYNRCELGRKGESNQDYARFVMTLHVHVLEKLSARGLPIVVGKAERSGKPEFAGLPDKHAYSVVDYFPCAKNPGMSRIMLRNPFGHGEPVAADGRAADGNNDGTFIMQLADFLEEFDVMFYPSVSRARK